MTIRHLPTREAFAEQRQAEMARKAAAVAVDASSGSGSGTTVHSGTATVDFGAFPGASEASVVVTGQTGILAGSIVMAWIYPSATADHSADEHRIETIDVKAGAIVPGTGFTIYARNTSQINEPLMSVGAATFRSAAASVYGYVAPSRGGRGTRLYGEWSVMWQWI